MSVFKKSCILLSLIIGVLGLSSFTLADAIYAIKPFEAARIKTSINLSKNPKYLASAKVAYDKDGEATEDDVKISYDKKSPYTLIVTPKSAGWRPETTYYVIVGSKPQKVHQFRTKAYEYKTISGKVKLEQGEKAYTDIEIEMQATTFDDTTSYFTTKTKIFKGKDSAAYTLKVPVNHVGYSLSYDILSRDYDDSYNVEYYINPGYVNQKNMTAAFVERKKLLVKGDIKQDIIVITDKVIKNKVKEIIAKVIKPGMTAYEKEVALFKYVIENIEYDYDSYNDGIHRERFLYNGLIQNKTICVGFASIMQLFFDMEGIESFTMEGGTYSGIGHIWNVVKLEGKYYNVDATGGSFRYLNFTDEQENYSNGEYIEDNGLGIICNSYDYNYNFRTCWENNGIEIGTIDELQGIVTLPDGQVAPAGGMLVRVNIYSKNDAVDVMDDFVNTIHIAIPEGKSLAKYSIKVIPSFKDYVLTLLTYTERMLYYQVRDIDLSKTKNIDVQLEPMSHINISLSLPEAVKALPKEIKLDVFCVYDDGSASGFKKELVFSGKAVTIPAGMRTVETFLQVDSNKGPYVIYYEITNKEDFPNYAENGYYCIDTGSSDYNSATKLLIDDKDIDINLVLRTKQ